MLIFAAPFASSDTSPQRDGEQCRSEGAVQAQADVLHLLQTVARVDERGGPKMLTEESAASDVANQNDMDAPSLLESSDALLDSATSDSIIAARSPVAALLYRMSSYGSSAWIEKWGWPLIGLLVTLVVLTAIGIVALVAFWQVADFTQVWIERWPTYCALLLFTATCCDGMLLDCIVPLTRPLGAIYGVGDAWIGVLFGAKGLVQLLSAPFTAQAVNKIGHRQIICGGLLIEIGSTAVYAFSGQTFALALFARAVQGVASSSILVGGQSLLARVAPESSAPWILGLAFVGFPLGATLGPAVGGIAAAPAALGIHGMFAGMSCILAIVLLAHLVVLFLLMPTSVSERLTLENTELSGRDKEGQEIGVGQIFRTPAIQHILLPFFAYVFVIAALQPLAPMWANYKLGVSVRATGKMGVIWSAEPIGFGFFLFASSSLAARYPKHLLMAHGLLIMLFGVVGLRITTEAFGFVPLFLSSLFFVGAGAAFVEAPGLAAMAEALPKAEQAAGFAAFDMSAQMGFMLGPFVSCCCGLTVVSISAQFIVISVCLGILYFALLGKPFEICPENVQQATRAEDTQKTCADFMAEKVIGTSPRNRFEECLEDSVPAKPQGWRHKWFMPSGCVGEVTSGLCTKPT